MGLGDLGLILLVPLLPWPGCVMDEVPVLRFPFSGVTWLRLCRRAVHLPVPRRFRLCVDCARSVWGLFDRDASVRRELVGVAILVSSLW